MAVTNKLTLWQLAAAYMGQTAQSAILNPDSPSTPFERTFASLYDNVRVESLRAIAPEFARRVRALRLAPTIDYQGDAHVWNDRWAYVYAPPTDMIKFLRFADAIPDARENPPYQQIPLPIAYTELTATNQTSFVLTAPIASAMPAYLYRNWIRGEFFDDSLVKHSIIDSPDAADEYGFDWKDEASGTILPGAVTASYVGTFVWSVDFEPGALAGVYDLAASPTTFSVEIAYGNPHTLAEPGVKYTQHIATEVPNAEAVYVVDVTDPSLWPVEFQSAVAYELAFRASIVHAKSPRLITALEKQAFKAQSLAISSLASDDGAFEGGGPSRATLARR